MDPKQIAACDRLAQIFPEFTVEGRGESCWAVRLKHKTIAQAELFVDISKDKWEFSGVWPRARGCIYSPSDSKSIGVNSERDNDAIFRDVTKRLINWYLPELEIQKKKFDEANQRVEYRNQQLNVLLAAMDEPIRERENTVTEVNIYQSELFDSVRIGYDGNSVDLKLKNIDFKLALELISVLKDFDKKEAA